VERLFSNLGDIKTKKRNRLGTKKLRDTAFVKSELCRCHAKSGTARTRLKRRFGNEVTELDSDPTGSRMLDEEMVRAAEESNERWGSDSDDDDELVEDAQQFSRLAKQFKAAAIAADEDSDNGIDADEADVPLPATSNFPRRVSSIYSRYSSQCWIRI
jgi:hypothetical protein